MTGLYYTFYKKFVYGLRYFLFSIIYGFGRLGKKVVFDSGVEFENPRNIYIGNNVRIGKDSWIRSGVNGKIVIEDGVDIGRRVTISAEGNIYINSDVIIAPNVLITDHNHKFDDVFTSIKKQGTTKPENVTIGSGSWVGTNVVILPNSHLGEHCVVGANSVVKNKFPPMCVIAGVPAKVVKKIA